MQWDWNFDQWGFCNNKNQCLVSREGESAVPSEESESGFREVTASDFYESISPICINNDEYIFDHYCAQGNWTTRTKYLAGKLLDETGSKDFTLYCAPYRQALLNYGIQDSYLGGSSQNIIEEPSSGLLAEPQNEIIQTCFNNQISESFQRLIPAQDNTCINNVCLIQFDEKTLFATTLNKDLTAEDSFLLALDPNQQQQIAAREICPIPEEEADSEEFFKCTESSLEGDLWYSPKLKMIIYSKEGINLNPGTLAEFWENVKAWFASLFGQEPPVGVRVELFNELQNYNKLYASKNEDKEVHALREIVPSSNAKKELIVVEYENYNAPLCNYVDDLNKLNQAAYESYGVEPLEGESGYTNLLCNINGNVQRVEGVAYKEGIDYLWPQLTSKLRME